MQCKNFSIRSFGFKRKRVNVQYFIDILVNMTINLFNIYPLTFNYLPCLEREEEMIIFMENNELNYTCIYICGCIYNMIKYSFLV